MKKEITDNSGQGPNFDKPIALISTIRTSPSIDLELKDVLNIFEPHAQPDKIVGDSGGELRFRGKLAVGCSRRMDGKTLRVANIGKMAEELQAFDEFLPCFHAALDSEPKDGT